MIVEHDAVRVVLLVFLLSALTSEEMNSDMVNYDFGLIFLYSFTVTVRG